MDGSDSPIISIIFTKHQNQKVDMDRSTKMTTDDFESVESLPDWAVPSFDCYLKYVCEGGLSTGEFMKYHKDWLKIVVKLDQRILGNRPSRKRSGKSRSSKFISEEATNWGPQDEEAEQQSESGSSSSFSYKTAGTEHVPVCAHSELQGDVPGAGGSRLVS